ncbi:hypothetical protein MHW47_03210 [Streptomyces sp. OfavH-34-F]|uniref:hypothetical protein n=1 Tax=Streptomyces sp. OfavH-34-F TaxID=2917760 RepID=UPI001EF26EF1|nr:hypothetical protein [Streptomyces sp. OfavH-34-F]MCG7523456.1 hypothetical protein [Streptomyces sp. OfavH-34-F]
MATLLREDFSKRLAGVHREPEVDTQVIAFLIDVVGALLIPHVGGKRRTRAQARAFAEGGEVLFEACVLGDRPYCRPHIVFLAASRTALHLSPTEVKTLARRSLPTERIEIRQIRRRTRSDPRIIRPFWDVADCHDGSADFVVACAPDHMRYFAGSLQTEDPK